MNTISQQLVLTPVTATRQHRHSPTVPWPSWCIYIPCPITFQPGLPEHHNNPEQSTSQFTNYLSLHAHGYLATGPKINLQNNAEIPVKGSQFKVSEWTIDCFQGINFR